MNSLEEKGFIKKKLIYKKGTNQIEKRVMNICSPPYPAKLHYPSEENITTPSEENCTDNNTSFNNTFNNTNNNKEKNNIKKETYLEFVKLTEEEYNKLIEKMGLHKTNDLIERLNNYIGSKGKKYKSHYHTILSWSRKDKPSYQNKDTNDFGLTMEDFKR